MTTKLNGFEDTLFNTPKKNSNLSDQQVLDYYKLCIASVEQISNRRQTANSFFLTINTVLLSFLSYLSIESLTINYALFAVSFAGVAICYTWRRMILSYRELNGAKFDVILALESKLPIGVYGAEWLLLEEGKNPAVHRPFSNLEVRVPNVFIILHVFVLIMYFSTLI